MTGAQHHPSDTRSAITGYGCTKYRRRHTLSAHEWPWSAKRECCYGVGTGPIFDVDNMLRVEECSPNLWPSTVKEDIPKIAAHVKATFESHGKTKTFMRILTEQG
jgi:hypothetical protein